QESYCDATLACDGRFYPVHKLVLSTCSEYFEQIFERTQCKHPVIVLKDIKYDDLEALMNYMYVGEVNVLQEKLAGLIKAAECLKIKGLAVPDEDPLSGVEKRNQIRVDTENPHAKRRKRDDSYTHEDRERPAPSRNLRLSQRDHQQISQLESHNDHNQIEPNVIGDTKLTSDNHNQSVESESEQPDSEPSRKQRPDSGPLNQRTTSQKSIPEVSYCS
ncbi:UNVERIFIED_CONTAM: hypothetical protein GTU68_052724, partial [Idotea baltica]|nr:hypothetical protein [Idotea baltica]